MTPYLGNNPAVTLREKTALTDPGTGQLKPQRLQQLCSR